MIILRSDGTPTYNLAVVVDDHDMGVTHVIRGVDHLTNAARQVQIYKAMGWELPVFAHIPLIHGPDGAKLSKRHGALGVEAYRAMGYPARGLRNYLARLGWSHGDDEIFSTEQMIEWFDIDDINKAPGRLDFAKLADVNAHYIRAGRAPTSSLARIKDFLPERRRRARARRPHPGGGLGQAGGCAAEPQGAGQDPQELVDGAGFFWSPAPTCPRRQGRQGAGRGGARHPGQAAGAVRGRRRLDGPGHRGRGSRFRRGERPEARQSRPAAACRTHRPAVSPPVFDVMAVLGRDEALARIRDQAQ